MLGYYCCVFVHSMAYMTETDGLLKQDKCKTTSNHVVVLYKRMLHSTPWHSQRLTTIVLPHFLGKNN